MSKLEKMLKYVSEHNGFYKNIIQEHNITDPMDIAQYPILTREQLQKNRYNMFSDGYKSKYFMQQLRRQSSSGSTGIPVNVYWDYKDWYASNMALWRKRVQWYGIHPSNRYAIFTLSAFNINAVQDVYYIRDSSNILSVNVSLLHDERDYQKIVYILNKFDPEWLYVQPFILNKLIFAYKKLGISKPSSLRYIESIGEFLASDLKRRAIEFFKVPLANMYGSEEMNGIAFECPYHRMHLLNDNVLMEIRNENGVYPFGKGETIITNLSNLGMPLIRYNQGDQIVVNSSYCTCACGCTSQTIDLIVGRSSASIIIGDTEINSFMLAEVIAEVNNQFNDIIISYYYIYYMSDKTLMCNITLDESSTDWFLNVKNSISKAFASKIESNTQYTLEINLSDKPYDFASKRSVLKIIK